MHPYWLYDSRLTLHVKRHVVDRVHLLLYLFLVCLANESLGLVRVNVVAMALVSDVALGVVSCRLSEVSASIALSITRQ